MSDDAVEQKGFERHPIQLQNISVRELSIKPHVPPDVSLVVDGGSFHLTIGHSEYDEENKVVGVATKIEIGRKYCGEEFPFEMKVQLVGEFIVDDTTFPMDQLEHWADNNAPLLIYPYLREHVFALSARCGFTPLLLPLFVLPAFNIEKPQQ